MHRVISVHTRPGFILVLRFNDGTEGDVDVSDRLFGPMFEPLRDPKLFDQVRVDDFGAVCWPNRADLAPDTLYQQVKRQ